MGIPEHDLPEPESEGATLLQRYCKTCHALPSPKSHTAEHWKETFDRMFSRMRMMDHEGMMGREGMMDHGESGPWGRWMWNVEAPTDEEAKTLLAYLERHALAPAPDDFKPDPRDPTSQLFSRTCSQCHALPDPRQHTAADWPSVVSRMRQNMELMSVGALTDQEAQSLVAFLSQRATTPSH